MRSFIPTMLIGLILVANGCNGGDSPTAPEEAVGRFELQSIGEQTLPYRYSESGENWAELLSESIVLSSDYSYTVGTSLRFSYEGQISYDQSGSNGRFEISGASGLG